jgi:hypothetical protein
VVKYCISIAGVFVPTEEIVALHRMLACIYNSLEISCTYLRYLRNLLPGFQAVLTSRIPAPAPRKIGCRGTHSSGYVCITILSSCTVSENLCSSYAILSKVLRSVIY